MRRRVALAAVLAAALAATAPAAQEAPSAPAPPILTVDQEELFAQSAFGRRVQAEFERDSAALAAENRRIEAALEAEERELTAERATMAPEAFRAKAADFDARVVEFRRVQDQKARDLSRAPEEARQQFFRAALPILAALVGERGALAILDSRAVILSAESIDITDEAIRRIDAGLGDGSGDGTAPAPPPALPAPGETPAPEAAPLP